MFAAGVEYALPSLPELALRLEYQWLTRVGKLRNYNGVQGQAADYTHGSVLSTLVYLTVSVKVLLQLLHLKL